MRPINRIVKQYAIMVMNKQIEMVPRMIDAILLKLNNESKQRKNNITPRYTQENISPLSILPAFNIER